MVTPCLTVGTPRSSVTNSYPPLRGSAKLTLMLSVMPPSVKPPDLMAMIAAFAGPLQINGWRRILRVRRLRAPTGKIVRKPIGPCRFTSFRLRVKIETTSLKNAASFLSVHFLRHGLLLGTCAPPRSTASEPLTFGKRIGYDGACQRCTRQSCCPRRVDRRRHVGLPRSMDQLDAGA